jgi:hypothetical protein
VAAVAGITSVAASTAAAVVTLLVTSLLLGILCTGLQEISDIKPTYTQYKVKLIPLILSIS